MVSHLIGLCIRNLNKIASAQENPFTAFKQRNIAYISLCAICYFEFSRDVFAFDNDWHTIIQCNVAWKCSFVCVFADVHFQ